MKTNALVEQLKLELNARGLTYAELAQKINLSEAAVKRLFSEKNFSLNRLDEICEATGLDLLHLTIAASQTTDVPQPLSEKVEEELADDSDLLLTLYYALQGSTMLEIQKELKCDHRSVFHLCRHLESLRLIEVHKGNKIHCKVSRSTRWRPNGPLVKKYGQAIRDEFFASTFSSTDEFQDFLTGPLSKSSFEFFKKKLVNLFREFNEISSMELKDGAQDSKVFWFYSGLRPWAPIGVIRRVRGL